MEKAFIDILKQIVKEQTNAAFTDAKKCKAFLADYTKNEYKKESRLILIAVDAGMAKSINDADDLEACKKTQIRDLDDDYALDTDVAEDIVNTLALVLRGDTNKTKSPSALKAAAEKAAAERAAVEKAIAEREVAEKAAAKKAAAAKRAANRAAAGKAVAAKWAAIRNAAAAKRAARKAAAQNAAAARRAARRSSSSSGTGSPIFIIVDRDSGDGSSILFGIIGAAIGLFVGGLIGGFIAIGLGGVIGWGIGHEIGKGIYVNLIAIILAIACGVLVAFLAGWTGNGLFPDWAPTIARILFIPFMIAGAALFIFARSRGNRILLITLVALSVGGAITLTEPPFPFNLSRNKAAAEETDDAQTAAEQTATVNSSVNFRAEPSTGNNIIRQLRQGDTVILTGETSSGWTQVSHNGDTGWVSSEFLTQGTVQQSTNTNSRQTSTGNTSAGNTAAVQNGKYIFTFSPRIQVEQNGQKQDLYLDRIEVDGRNFSVFYTGSATGRGGDGWYYPFWNQTVRLTNLDNPSQTWTAKDQGEDDNAGGTGGFYNTFQNVSAGRFSIAGGDSFLFAEVVLPQMPD
jgi:uncharacterized protein YraI